MPPNTAALPHRHRPGTARAAFSYRDFRWIWIGLFASNVGTWMQNFTLPAYVQERTGSAAPVVGAGRQTFRRRAYGEEGPGSAALVGVLVFTQLGPLLLLPTPAGVLANRYP